MFCSLLSCCINVARAAEEKGHAVHRSIRDIHDAMCNAVCSPSTSGKPMDSRWPVDSALSEKGRNRKCLALKDFYPYWRTKLEVAEAGKVLTIEPSENPKVRFQESNCLLCGIDCECKRQIGFQNVYVYNELYFIILSHKLCYKQQYSGTLKVEKQ